MEIDCNFTNEAEVQYSLAKALEASGFEVYLERNFKLPNMEVTSRKKNTPVIRVDIVLVVAGKIKCLVEVKSGNCNLNTTKTRQYGKYKSLGYPFIYCVGAESIDEVVKTCVSKYLD